jgi:hypothetical protein
MTALPPEERPPGRPEPVDPSVPVDARAASSRRPGCPSDEVLDLLATVIAFQASQEAHELRRPPRGHPIQLRRWRRENEVLLLQRQMLKLRLDATPPALFAPFPRPVV